MKKTKKTAGSVTFRPDSEAKKMLQNALDLTSLSQTDILNECIKLSAAHVVRNHFEALEKKRAAMGDFLKSGEGNTSKKNQ